MPETTVGPTSAAPWTFSGEMEPFPIRDATGQAVNPSYPANGLLMAAAPELLQALKALLLRACVTGPEDAESWAVREQARVAIAKAGGA